MILKEIFMRDIKPQGACGATKEKIEAASLGCWHVFGLKGYARVDMRVDKNDSPFVIEVNANPCMSPDSGLVAATIAAGIPFTDILTRILSDLNI
jgi:D-alanine-D-alanine ligase